MKEGQHLVVEGVPLDEIARLCFEHSYRWSLHGGAAANGHTRFDLKPGPPAAPVGYRPPLKSGSSEE